MVSSYSFLTISGTTLTLTTSTVTDAGTHNLDITVGLTNYASVAAINVPLTVVITC
jgi:hypothetical protein